MTGETIPYCGPAPTPDTVWTSWNFDPFVIVALLGLVGFYAAYGLKGRNSNLRFSAAIILLVVIFISPLCALSSALFSARVFHHMLLVAVAAPLLASVFAETLSGAARFPVMVFVLHTAMIWLWHTPEPYAFALSGTLPYWLMELSLVVSGMAMWRAILNSQTGMGTVMSLLLGSIIQMGMLGALLTFATQPLFEHHFATTMAFGLSPLADQQLAGLLMWVPAALPYVLFAVLRFASFLGNGSGIERAKP